MFNHSCFYNAVSAAKADESVEVFECILIEDGTPVLHYLNYDSSVGKYKDHTLGYRAELYTMEYYIIRRISPLDYDYIDDVFVRSQQFWTRRFSNTFLRELLNIGALL
jgi:hypothetical protein